MNQRPVPMAAFHLIGERTDQASVSAGPVRLQPALFSAFGDLSDIRHDYPVVLLDSEDEGDGAFVISLTEVSNGILREIAPPGLTGERIRRRVLALEREIRTRTLGREGGPLAQLWDDATGELIQRADKEARAALEDDLRQARAALKVDGDVVGCDAELPAALVTRAWNESRTLKMRRLGARIDSLAQKLADILRVDFMRSDKARKADFLAGSVGPAEQTVFDFAAMAKVLRSTPVAEALPKKRRQRIEAAIEVFVNQCFVTTTRANRRRAEEQYTFEFTDCADALEAFRERLPALCDLIKAISIAELEIENRYNEARHDAFFQRFDETRLSPEDLAICPSYLVCLDDGIDAANGQAALTDIIGAGLPFKVVVRKKDILEDLPVAEGRMAFGIRGQQLARMAVGLGGCLVIQAAASSLYRLRDNVLNAVMSDRPALFSVFVGDGTNADGGMSPYLLAAAATEARAFPAFVFDPDAGSDSASDYTLEGNPQAGADWPVYSLDYEDAKLNRQSDEITFTFVDFVAADPRYAGHFAIVPQADWHDDMIPVGEFLERKGSDTSGGSASKVPYIMAVGENGRLHRAIVDEMLVDGARRCRDHWRDLQQAAGLNDTRTEALLAEARAAWEEEQHQKLAAEPAPSAPAPQATTAQAAPVTETAPVTIPLEEPEPAPSGDDPYIETPRCTTCNECTDINDRMFAYNEDMQAYIKDPDAGTFRQLVEAAETCQVCIIHPGKPRDPNEPGLDELIVRAEPFNAM